MNANAITKYVRAQMNQGKKDGISVSKQVSQLHAACIRVQLKTGTPLQLLAILRGISPGVGNQRHPVY